MLVQVEKPVNRVTESQRLMRADEDLSLELVVILICLLLVEVFLYVATDQ